MPVSVTMPQLGESVTEGTVTRWLKQVGDTVAVGEPLLEVSTDKVDTEIPSPAAGVLLRISAAEDSVVVVGGELAVIGSAEDTPQAGGGDTPATGEAGQAAPVSVSAAGWDSSEVVDEGITTEIPIVRIPAAEPTASEPLTAPADEAPAAPTVSTSPLADVPTPVASADSGSDGVATAVVLPALGESVTEGTVTRWLKGIGDVVTADEPLLEVSTDKVDTEIPAPASGILLSIEVAEDGVAAVGAVLGTIGVRAPQTAEEPAQEESPAVDALAEQPPAAESPASESPAEEPPALEPPAEEPRTQEPATPEPTMGHAAATPLVRRLAAETGVDLATVVGTGVGGRIRKQDVLDAATSAARSVAATPTPGVAGAAPALAAVASPPPAVPVPPPPAVPVPPPAAAVAPATVPSPVAPPPPAAAAVASAPDAGVRGTTVRLSRLRRVIAERMLDSLRVSAQLTSVVEVDLTRVASLRSRSQQAFQAREGVKLTYLPFLAKAAIDALKQFPTLNASLSQDGTEVTYHDAEHLGIAVDTERGLLVPVIRNAGDLAIAGLARHIADLADRARTGRVMPDELSGGTFTLTNTGSRGALFDTPIINQPQVAILGTGAVVKRPVVIPDEQGSDSIAIRSMAYLCLTYDHRIVDGADAARFLSAIKRRLEEGSFDADLGM